MSAKGLDCNAWRRRRRITPEKLVVLIVGLCVVVAYAVVGASVAGSILASAGGLACCVPLADGFAS